MEYTVLHVSNSGFTNVFCLFCEKRLTGETFLCIIKKLIGRKSMQVKRRSTQVGRRGAPAKGVGRVTGARVQISPSPPSNKKSQLLNGDWLFYITRILYKDKASIRL